MLLFLEMVVCTHFTMTGLDSEINELVEGSDIYEPKVELSEYIHLSRCLLCV